MRQSQISEQKDMGPMVLRSSRVLCSIKVENISGQATSATPAESQSNIKDIIKMDGLGIKTGLDYRTYAEQSSTVLPAVHDQMGNPINLNVNLATEVGYNSGCPEVGVKMGQHSDNSDTVLCNDGALKEHSGSQMITFSRRSKKRLDAGERITDKKMKIVEKPSVSVPCSSRVVGANFGCEGSSNKHMFEEQVNSKPILLEKCAVPSSQVNVADETDYVKVDASSDYNAEVCTGSKLQKRSETSSGLLMPPLSAVDTCEELSKKVSTVQPVYVIKDYICPLNTEPSNSGNNAFISSVKESGCNLITDTNNCEKRKTTPLSEGDSLTDLELSVAPSSVCQMNLNMEANKRSNVVVLKNHRDSRSSFTPCCSIGFTDEENDARGKEIEWLESLDNVLRKKRKDRGTCSLIVDNVINRREGFNSIMPSKSVQRSVNNQKIGVDFMNYLSATPRNLSLVNSCNSSGEELLKTEKSTSFTDFMGCYLPSNPQIPLDLNAAAPPSGSHFRDNVYMHEWKLPYSSNENLSLFKYKHITENSLVEMVLNGNRGSSDKPKKYSSEWSEEELDFLWIGVRRHGVDSWNAMLRDPKLQFVQSRFPEDLALQWEQEQKKLFNGVLLPEARFSKPNAFSTPLLECHYTAKVHGYAENPQFTETKLSLGDVYLRKDNTAKSTSGLTYPPSSESSSTGPLLGNFLSMSSYSGATTRHKNLSGGSTVVHQMDHGFHKQFKERSGNHNKLAGTELPHWLKEACRSHPIPSDLPWPPLFSAGYAASLVNNDTGSNEPLTFKDLRGRGILRRKSTASGKNMSIIKIEEASASIEEPGSIKLCVTPIQIPAACEMPAIGVGASHQKNITDLSNNTPVSIVPNDLVVLDGGASSEETISDDQNRRPHQHPN